MSEFITPEVNIPQRNLSSELDQIYQANQRQAGPYYDLEAKYGPLYNRLNVRNLADQTLGWDEGGVHQPGTLEIGRAGTAFQREQDIGDVERLGGRAVEANLNANQWLRRSLNLLGDQETQSPILRTLNSQAESELASGGFLSPEMERANRETTRAAWSDRGLGNTDQSAIGELMNREAMRAGRVAASRKFAGDVEGLNSTFRDFLGRATQIDATALNDPWMSVLSRSGGGGASGGAGLTPIGSGTRVFDPYNPYAQDLFSSNQSAAGTEAIGNAQAQAATRAAIASIAGGFIGSDIRLKEKIVEVGVHRIPTVESHPRREVPIVEFSYRAGCVPPGLRADRRYIGVLAQDVEEVMSVAVRLDPVTGFKEVDYAMLGLEFKEAA